MTTIHRLTFVLAAGVLLAIATGAAQEKARASGPVVVGPNIRASANTTSGSRNECWITASPTDPTFLIAMSQTSTDSSGVGGTRGCATMISRNGGQTWREIRLPKEGEGCFDPMTVAAADGRIYVMHPISSRTPGTGGKGGLRFWSTTDAGKTWTGPGEAPVPVAVDHPRIVVDTSNGPHRGRLYVPWNESMDTVFRDKFHILMSYSDDGGRTFSDPILLDTTDGGKLVITEPVVLSDGTLLVTYYKYFIPLANKDNQHQPFFVLRSTDGGKTFDKPQKVVEVGASAWLHLRRDFGSAFTLPIVVADTSPASRFRDRIYVVWDDVTTGESNIWLTHSADKGGTWSKPVQLNDNERVPAGGAPDFRMTPVVNVNPSGVVGVAWYDRRDDPARRCWKQYFTASLDGGETFLKNVPIATAPSCPDKDMPPSVYVWNTSQEIEDTLPTEDELATLSNTERYRLEEPVAIAKAFKEASAGEKAARIRVAFDAGRSVWPGHYMGLTSDPTGAFHALWADRRSKLQQLFTTRLEVLTAPEPPTPPTQETVVTNLVQVVGGPAKFDEAKGTATFELQVRNVSDRPIYAPLKVRVSKIATAAGAPTAAIIDPDGGGTATVGPFWDFSKLIGSRGRFDPKMISEAKTVTIRVKPESGLDGVFEFEVVGHVAKPVTTSSGQK